MANEFFPESKSEPDPCKGVFCRYSQSAYGTASGWGMTQKLRVLKRLSCSGCPQCGGIEDHLREFPESLELSPELQDGDVAVLSIVVDSTDWETGYVDYFHVLASRVSV